LGIYTDIVLQVEPQGYTFQRLIVVHKTCVQLALVAYTPNLYWLGIYTGIVKEQQESGVNNHISILYLYLYL